jgi:uncharacterized phage protein (TIGR02216 family)
MSLDWPGLLRVGLFELGLSPDHFWGLTPVELRIMAQADALVAPLTRTRLEELARAFPDGMRRQDHD